jgi:Magnesium chelatase, subunit ChlI
MTISRASGSITFPANFTLIAAMNPCPHDYHGYHGDLRTLSLFAHSWERDVIPDVDEAQGRLGRTPPPIRQ